MEIERAPKYVFFFCYFRYEYYQANMGVLTNRSGAPIAIAISVAERTIAILTENLITLFGKSISLMTEELQLCFKLQLHLT